MVKILLRSVILGLDPGIQPALPALVGQGQGSSRPGSIKVISFLLDSRLRGNDKQKEENKI